MYVCMLRMRHCFKQALEGHDDTMVRQRTTAEKCRLSSSDNVSEREEKEKKETVTKQNYRKI